MLAVRGALNHVARSNGLTRGIWSARAQQAARSLLPTATTSATVSSSSLLFARRGMATNNQPASRQKLSESFLSGSSSSYVEQMYEAWRKDPSSVHASWNAFFKNADAGLAPGQAFHAPPALVSNADAAATASMLQQVSPGNVHKEIEESMKLLQLIRAYQVRGHSIANLDPLKMDVRPIPPELQIETYGWSEADLDREFFVGSIGKFLHGFIASTNKQKYTLREIVDTYKKIYCGSIGIEYMHIQDRESCNWIRERFENMESKYSLTNEEKANLIDRLAWADGLEKYLHLKFISEKRFGLDGCEALIPGMKAMIDHAADMGVNNVVIGMPHRGRLNVLANVLRKPLPAILKDFTASTTTNADDGYSGDVKYHLGTSYDRPTRAGKTVHLSLLANPSHLEAVDPVVLGKVRAKQFYLGDTADARKQVLGVLLHGDAAFSGQGVVFESFDLAGLVNYETGGTVHIVVNNQVGFTTDPKASRSSDYCTDVAKTINAPIFHVNGDDPEAVVAVFKLAAEWRQQFRKDVVIDVVCYRRYGHNEQDQAAFTQPLMAKKIASHPSTLDLYSQQLTKEGIMSADKVKKIKDDIRGHLDKGLEEAKAYKPTDSEWLSSKWAGFKSRKQLAMIKNTGVPVDNLKKVSEALVKLPDNFKAHPTIKRILQDKEKALVSGKNIDWATAEALAFGTLLLEGFHVRLSGQDVERGTFSQRHAVIHDQDTNKTFIPLNHITPDQAKFLPSNSSLSEFAVLGFELGYSLEGPNALILWEAQFGDFANGAQVIIDQFFSCGEAKWKNQCGLVILLPHGYEGNGPEHSSARIERFLQLSDSNPFKFPVMDPQSRTQIQETNLQIVNCTTPANYFHVLRRQIHREFRKPLVVFTPKSLLKHKDAVSSIDDFDDVGVHTRFQRVIPDSNPNLVAAEKVRKVLFCTGKVYYDLASYREKNNVNDVAIVRIEQLAPFPFDHVKKNVETFSNASVAWVQEEPMNQGAWNFVYHHIRTSATAANRPVEPQYVGRAPSASTATGFRSVHNKEQIQLVEDAFK